MPSRDAGPRGLSLALPHRWLLFLIAMEKGVGAVASALVATLALGLEGCALRLTTRTRLGSAAPVLHQLVTWLGTQLTPGRTGWGITFALWAVLLAAEAMGLWRGRVWAAALVLLETAIGIPVQAWSLTQQVSWEGVLVLAANGAVLIYVLHVYPLGLLRLVPLRPRPHRGG